MIKGLPLNAFSCGASKITAIEGNVNLSQLAKRILTLNGVENAKVVNEYSYEYNPEDGDLVRTSVGSMMASVLPANRWVPCLTVRVKCFRQT